MESFGTRGRIWIGANPALQLRIMQALHSSPLGGHSRFLVTYSRMRKLFAWRGLVFSEGIRVLLHNLIAS